MASTGTTPVKFNRIKSSPLSAASPDIKVKRRELRFSMNRKYVIIPSSQFMRRYAPTVREKRNGRYNDILKTVPVAAGKESGMYQPLVDALNKTKICPSLTFAITAARGDPSDPSNEAVDIGLYPADRVPQSSPGPSGTTRSPPTDWSSVELCIECKTGSDSHDPFDDNDAESDPTTEQRKDVLGQILSYAEFILKRQQRTCIFMVLLIGDCCRLLRFDRAGAIVTEKFNYQTKGGDLIEFLWRYGRWDAATRGHDPTAEKIEPTSPLGKKMQARAQKDRDTDKPGDYVRRLFEESLDTRWSWWKLRVDDKSGARFFLVGKPNFQAPGVSGRGTRGYVALDANDINGPFYYLKDAWRVVNRNVDKEGTILQYLNKKGVPHIPTLECHGDVTEPAEQYTKTHKLWLDLHKGESETKVCPMKQHKHYRVVVKEVGQPMSKFIDGRRLLFALWCCILAHSEAYEAGVIHRDISAGNVLLYYDSATGQWFGLLNDWELSKCTEKARPEGRQLDRTGTWQFMSALALNDATKEITIEDELESFFHVLLFFAIRYLPHNCPNVGAFMYDYFDDYRSTTVPYSCGSYKLLCMMRGNLPLAPDPRRKDKSRNVLKFFCSKPNDDVTADSAIRPHPLNDILATVLGWLRAHYALATEGDGQSNTAHSTTCYTDPTPLSTGDLVFTKRKATAVGAPAPPAIIQLTPTEEERAKLEAVAKNLRTHTAILDLLESALRSAEWPATDKTADQLPKEGYNPRADPKQPSSHLPKGGSMHMNASGAGPSRKRSSDEIDEPAAHEQPKRTRPQTRMSTRKTRSRNARQA
ncbi:hypothetical protein OH77DRAFT_1395440 [Trametes cingulata]|nr:hypothetical protein OH77DRAFT_1395440 [Trametes cingulata]